jgi:hypothetical protein
VKALLAAVAVAVVGAAGCSGAATPTPVAAATAAPAADSADLTGALLTVGDLPLGFQAQDGAGTTAALGCAGIDGVYLPAGEVSRAAASFGHSLSPAFINETITRQPARAAAAAMAAFAAAAKDCARFAGPDGTAYTVTTVALPRYGDGSAALRVTSGLAEGRPVDLAAVRVGSWVIAVAAAGSGGDDAALTRSVVDRALAKLSRPH